MLHSLPLEGILWIAVTAFCACCVLWRVWLYPRWQKVRIAKIEAFEREKDGLTRGILIRKILLRLLMIPVFLWLGGGVLYICWVLIGGAEGMSGLWQFPLVFSLLILALGLPTTVKQSLAIRKGTCSLRRLVASGTRTESSTWSKAGSRVNSSSTFYYLGTAMGDSSLSTMTRLELGTWYLAVIADGDVVIAVPAARWRPDLELKKLMPPDEANRC